MPAYKILTKTEVVHLEFNYAEHNNLSRVLQKPVLCIYAKTIVEISCGCTCWFVLDLVGNPEDRFSCEEARLSSIPSISLLQLVLPTMAHIIDTVEILVVLLIVHILA